MYRRDYYLKLIDQDLRTVDVMEDINPEQIKHMKIYNSITINAILIITFVIITLLAGCILYQHATFTQKSISLNNEINKLTTLLEQKQQEDIIYLETGKAFINNDIPFPKDSLKLVYDYIKKIKAWYPDIIFAQLILESDKGKSFLAKNCNNYFGMKKAMTRPSLQLPETYNGYAIKLNWQHSIIDRILWDKYIFDNKKPNKDFYLNKLQNIYAEDKNYLQKIDNIIKVYNYSNE